MKGCISRMEFYEPTSSVKYRHNYDRIFGEKKMADEIFEANKARLESVLCTIVGEDKGIEFVRKAQTGNPNKNNILRRIAQEIVDQLPTFRQS